MRRLLLILCLILPLLSGCRYWVLYKFADQFCDFDDYVQITLSQTETPELQILFHEPVLNRPILLRYLNAHPFKSHYSYDAVISRDYFAITPQAQSTHLANPTFEFSLAYHPVKQHALLASATLDSRLASLFTPALVEPILRSICSDDYDLSSELLEMRFKLERLDQASLPSFKQITRIFGASSTAKTSNPAYTELSYTFDFLIKDPAGAWLAQNKPVTMLFGFDQHQQLNSIYIEYYMYRYWLDIETRSGRLVVVRK